MKVRKPTGALDSVNLWVCEMAGAESDFDDDDGWMDVVHMNFLWGSSCRGETRAASGYKDEQTGPEKKNDLRIVMNTKTDRRAWKSSPSPYSKGRTYARALSRRYRRQGFHYHPPWPRRHSSNKRPWCIRRCTIKGQVGMMQSHERPLSMIDPGIP